MARSPAAPKALRDAVKGLTFPSETDAPLEAFAWPAGRLDAAGVRAATGAGAKTPVESMTLAAFLRALPRQLHADYFPLMVAIADSLSEVTVFKIGETRLRAYIVGRTRDGIRAGVTTELVET